MLMGTTELNLGRVTYVSINPNVTVHPMYTRKAVSMPDRDRVCATRLRLSSHSLATETGGPRWSRIYLGIKGCVLVELSRLKNM